MSTAEAAESVIRYVFRILEVRLVGGPFADGVLHLGPWQLDNTLTLSRIVTTKDKDKEKTHLVRSHYKLSDIVNRGTANEYLTAVHSVDDDGRELNVPEAA